MNIQSVDNFNAAVSQLKAIKGDVTSQQLEDLTALFSTQIWNTIDAEGTSATIERQIQELEALLDEIQAEMDELYAEQKEKNEEMAALVNDLNEESYQASVQADKNIKQQQDAVTAATDEAYAAYMKGDISKEEIPLYIATKLKKTNSNAGKQMETHLEAMDSKGKKITSLSNKIAAILDSVNEHQAKFKTTETSLALLKQLKAQMPAKKERADIQQTTARPYFSPSQEALGDKIMDNFTEVKGGGDVASIGNPAVVGMSNALKGSVTVDDARKAELDAMTPEAKAAAVEEADFSKYSALELMYLSGMDVVQAGFAIGHMFKNAAIGYNEQTGGIVVPLGHDEGAAKAYQSLVSQYKTLWGGEVTEDGGIEPPDPVRGDPIGWREGDTNFMFAVDRDNDGKFDGSEEFLGAQNGWAEMAALDMDGDNKVSADELAKNNIFVVEVDQKLKGGGNYGFNGAVESGVNSIDLTSYEAIAAHKATNLNGNTRVAEFDMVVDDKQVLGKQTENDEAYNELFYGHMEGEALSFGLNPEEVSRLLAMAASPENYTELEQEIVKLTEAAAQATIKTDEANMEAKEEELAGVNASAANNTGSELPDDVNNDKNKEKEEETATNTTDNTASDTTTTTATNTADTQTKIPEV